jgi:hypothetical protein
VEEIANEDQTRNESIVAGGPPIGDNKLLKVALKIRDAIAEKTKAYDNEVKVLKDQLSQIENEVIRRLQERGSTQTKTEFGTAFLGEKMTCSIADEGAFEAFVIAEKDLAFYQKRVKVEHLREYMTANEGRLPPGLSIFKEVTLNLRKKS